MDRDSRSKHKKKKIPFGIFYTEKEGFEQPHLEI